MKNISIFVCFWLGLTSGIFPAAAQELHFQAESKPINQSHGTLLRQEPKQADPNSNNVFEFSLKKDLPLLAGSGALSLAGFLLMNQVQPLTEGELATLDPSTINGFDRAATRQYRVQDANLSDILLTISTISPFSVLASRSVRRELAPVLVMYVETAALAGGLTSISKGAFHRKRPFAYNPEALLSDRLSVDAHLSFFSGHVSTSASFSFLTAYMVNRYADREGWKIAAWAGAVVIPGTIGYWRYTSGKHFPTDILVGYFIGAGSGILIPHLHRWQLPPDVSLNLQPTPNGVHLTITF